MYFFGMAVKVLVSGGSGLIGTALTELLQRNGDHVGWLTRDERRSAHIPAANGVKLLRWDPLDGVLDSEAIRWCDAVVHLAGAGVAERRWTARRLRVIREGGALPKMAGPFRAGLGSPLGSSRQYISWIHIEDLYRTIATALADPAWSGTFNGVAPEPVTNAEFSRELARALDKPYFLRAVPGFMPYAIFGKMADIVLGGTRASSKKVEATGFAFGYPTVLAALGALYGD